MRRTIPFLLALGMLLSLAACGGTSAGQSPSPSAPSRDERNAEYATPTARMKSPVAVSTAPSRKNRSFLSVILHTEHIFLCTDDFAVISFAGIILSPVPEPVFRFYKIYFDHRGKMSLSDAPDEILR